MGRNGRVASSPECVILSRAPVAFLWTRISFERASRVRGTKAPDFAIFVLLSSEMILVMGDGKESKRG